ncbi:mucin-17-like isoform X5 [Penaeus japonicus]|uniref:mucin-17-like isoform X5 n=2 Tax=Penaeus japonicus TaxID=27405 RepID=UPI001C715DCB|nr:mucin-17-like isoform X5 [Penaeus japonicus]
MLLFSKRTLVPLSALLVACFVTSSAGEYPEWGCDPETEQPCRTNSSLCVPLENVGDGFIDCPDGSDEDCPDGWFVCEDRSACVAPDLLQDGVPDCLDETDEVCDDWQHECLCGFPRCIDSSLVGDGVLDCLEGSDELAIDKDTYICPTEVAEGQEMRRKRRQANAPVRIPVHGTFFTQSPSGQHAKLEVSLVDGILKPDPVGDEIVTLMGTQGQFIKEGVTQATTYDVFTGSYVKDLRTYLFFFGNTALPGHSLAVGEAEPSEMMHTEVVVKKGGVQSKILVDMEKDLQVIMPSKTHVIDATVAPDLLMGEGMFDGRKMGGVFIEGSEGFEMEGAQTQSGETSMLTITIGRPVAHTRIIQASSVVNPVEVTVLSMEEKLRKTDVMDNEIDDSLLRARKVHFTGDEIIADLQPSSPVKVDIPTFTIDHSNVPLEAVVGVSKNTVKSVGKSVSEGHQQSSEREGKSIDDIRAKFNLGTGGDDSDLPTVTYVGFADFTTTIADTVVVFTPRSGSPNKVLKPQIAPTKEVAPTKVLNPTLETEVPEVTSLAPRLATSRRTEEELIIGTPSQTPPLKTAENVADGKNMETMMVSKAEGTEVKTAGLDDHATDNEVLSTISTRRFNTIDLYPTGLVSSIGGTIVMNDMTTLLTTYVYGTYIQGQYAQIVQSTSSIFYLVPLSSTQDIQATKPFESITTTTNFDYPEPTTEFFDLYEYDFEGPTTEDLPPKVVEEIVDNALGRSVASSPNKQQIVDTDKENDQTESPFKPDPVDDLIDHVTTLTLYTTYFENGQTTVSTSLQTSTVLRPFTFTQDSTLEVTPTEEPEVFPTEELKTYTYYTTLFVDGSSTVSSHTEVHTKGIQNDFSTATSLILPTFTATELETATTTPATTPLNDVAVVEAISIDEYDLTTESVVESYTESMSESMSESSTDSSAQDVTEAPGFSLDSSLNPEEEVSSAFLPRTYYTTYTYFTTYYRSGTSSIVSSLETQTNVLSDPDDQEKYKTLTPEVLTYPVTYYTTYTYWTTYFRENTTSSVSSEKTVSNVVTPTAQVKPTVVPDLLSTTSLSPTFVSTTKSSTPAVTTFYTTYTYYTSTYIGDSTIVNSRLETKTEVVTATPILPVFATTTEESTKSSIVLPSKSTGLLSTIRGSTVVDGTTTIFSTDIIGTVVDGLYAQIQSTTSFTVAPTFTSTPVFILPTLTKDTTEETLPFFLFPTTSEETTTSTPFFIFPITSEETSTETTPFFILPTSKTKESTSTPFILFPTATEETTTESEIVPFFLFPTTTQKTSSSLATIEELFSAIAESVLDAPTTRPQLFSTPTLDSSLNDAATDTLAIESATEALPEEEAVTEPPEEEVLIPSPTTKSKLQFTPTFKKRPSGSRNRPDLFQFIRRSSFRQWSATVTNTDLTPTVTATPASNSEDVTTTSSSRPFRFGFGTSAVRTTPTSSLRFRFSTPGAFGASGISSGIGRTSSARPGSTSGFRFGSTSAVLRGSSSPGGFRFAGTRSSVFPGSASSISPSSVFSGLTVTAAPESDLEVILDDDDKSSSNNPESGFRPFSFRPRQPSNTPGTRSSVPFSNTPGTRSSIPFTLFNRRPNTPKRPSASASRFTPKEDDEPEEITEITPIVNPTTEAPVSFRRQTTNSPRRNRFRQNRTDRTDLSKLFPRRNRDLQNEASELNPVYVEAGGRLLTQAEFDEILAQEVTVLKRRKRQANFGERTSRGNARPSRNNPPPDLSRRARITRPTARVAPSPPRSSNNSPFTLTPSRGRSRAPEPEVKSTPSAPTRENPRARGSTARQSRPTPSTSRTSLPQRPRSSRTRSTVPIGNIRGRGFRRPSTDNNFRPSSKFTPNRQSPIVPPSRSPVRRPTLTSSRGSTRESNRNKPQENPITAFRKKPTPDITTEAPAIFPSDDGGFLIQEEITVTREIPVKATIPVVEDGQTLQKEVITASLQTEIIQPDQITQSTIDGTVRLVLSTFAGEKDITHYVVDPVETTSVTHTRTFVGGRRTSVPVEIPTTAYNVITVTETKASGDIQQLLSLLLGQQQQQNPLLAALGLGQPMTSERVHTRSYVTTVTNHISTAIPVILRGKTIQTTVVDTEVKVITATELSTETILTQNTASPFINPNPLNQLLPILLQGQLQQQSPQMRPTREPSIDTQSITPQLLEQALKKQEALRTEIPTPSPPTPSPVETSIVTLYVSGKRPGEFSTLLSTVTLSGDSTRIKRGSLTTKDVQPTILPHYIETDKGIFQLPETYEADDMDWFIMSAMNEIDTSDIRKVTPSLESVLGDLSQYSYQSPESISYQTSPFLWEGPAESTPLKRNVRSAQRGINENQGELRLPGARKIQDGTRQQIVEDERPVLGQFNIPGLRFQSRLISEQIQQLQAPTTYYTTFTYYTTLVDDIGREYVQSSEETITQLATHGNVRFDDFTRIGGESPLLSAVPIQSKFTLEDAIIPGKPRPVPDPVFEEPEPPFGPVIREPTSQSFQSAPEPAGLGRQQSQGSKAFDKVPTEPFVERPSGRKVPASVAEQLIPQQNLASEQDLFRDENIEEDPVNLAQNPRRIVLTRKRPVSQQSPEDRRRVVITRKRPVNQKDELEGETLPIDEPVTTEQLLRETPASPSLNFFPDGDLKRNENAAQPDVLLQGTNEATIKATHEIMEMEEQDQEEEIPGEPGSSRRVRVTVTKRRPVQLTETEDIADKTTTLSGGRRRVVVTRRLPQPTVVASPLRPLVATVNTFYTVYSYLYTLYENQAPFSVSTREVTVSNQIDPTVVSVLPTFHTGRAATGLYTLETGFSVATVGERVIDTFTTQIFLASATLINITPEAVQKNTEQKQTDLLEITTEPPLSISTTTSASLQSSLAEDEASVTTSTPVLTTSSFRATRRGQQTSLPNQRGRERTTLPVNEITTAELTKSSPSRAGIRNRGRGTVRFVDNRQRNRITVTRRRPVASETREPRPDSISRTLPERVTTTALEEETFLGSKELTESPKQPVIDSPRQRLRPTVTAPTRPRGRPGTSREPEDLGVEDVSEPPQPTRRPSIFGLQNSRRQPETPPSRFRDRVTPKPTEEPFTEEVETEAPPVTDAPVPSPTPTKPTRPPRTSLRRDDIPIIRRPGSSRPARPFVHQDDSEAPSLRFTPAPEPKVKPTDPPLLEDKAKPTDAPVIEEIDPLEDGIALDDYYYDDYYYDDYYYDENGDVLPLDETTGTEILPLDEATEDETLPLDETTGDETLPVDELSEVTPKTSTPTTSTSRPRFVRPTQLTFTTSSFDIIEALKRERTYTQIVAPTRTRGQGTRRRTRTQEPSTTSSMASNVVYSTYATTTLLPILGGEQSITLTILTSTLTTLAEEEIHLITDSPELFDPALITTTTGAPSLSVPLLSLSSISLSPTSAAASPDASPTLSLFTEDVVASTTDTESQVSPTLPAPQQSSSRAFGFRGSLAGIGGSGQGSGRAVGGQPGSNLVGFLESSQVDPSGQRLGARFSIGARHNLATRVMSNGVEVIVAGDKTASPQPQEQVITNNFEKFRRPITLPPSTLSDHMLLFASQEPDQVTQLAGGDDGSFQTNTYFTTYTYYNTLLAGNRPFVITSKQTVQNVVTVPLPDAGSFIERTEVTFDTQTYFTTQTFTRTGADEQVVTSQEVLTQVVITEAPTVERSTVAPSSTSLITKTYFTTLTYYNTAQDGQISSDTVVSSEVVTETTYVTPTPTLAGEGAVSLTPTPALEPEVSFNADQDELVVYATKTLYTTLTYLTTILEGSETVTASRIEVSSSIVTEPLASALSLEELNSIKSSYLADQLRPTAAAAPEPQTVMYYHIRDNLYKQLRTFFATYTHYTTMIGGEVHSRLETKTKILTSTVTTASVPESLLIRPTAAVEPIFATDVGSSAGPSLQLDPSYLSSLKSSFLAGKPTVGDPGEEEGLMATVLVEEGDASGTFVVSDSTTSATLLVRPTDEPSTSSISGQTIVIVDSAHLSSLKSSYLASLSAQLASTKVPSVEPTVSPSPTVVPAAGTTATTDEEDPYTVTPDPVTDPTVTTSILNETTVVTGTDGTPTVLTPGETVVVVDPGDGGETTILPEVPFTVRPDLPNPEDLFPGGVIPAAATGDSSAGGDGSTSSSSSDDGGSEPAEGSSGGISITGSGNNGLNIDLGPMLTAVAGILRNNLNSQIASKSDDNRRKINSPLRPPNTLISAEREPLFIPVGGVGASLSSSRDHTEGPEHGFIPLRRPTAPETQPRFPAGAQDPPRGAPALSDNPGFIKIMPELPDLPTPIHFDDMEKFGPTFLPPQKTQSGFTAITTESLGPTRVSVISGSQTIFFGGVDLQDLPPPGQPAPTSVQGASGFERTSLFLQPSQPVLLEETRPVPVPVRVPVPGDGGPIPLLVTPQSLADQLAEGDTQADGIFSRPSPQLPQPSRVGPATIVSIEGDNRIVGTQIVHARPVDTYRPEPSVIVSPARGEFVLQSTVGVGILSSDSEDDQRPRPPPGLEGTVLTGAETILVGQGADSGRTTVVRGSSTVMSGATTIFKPLFTRPAADNEPLGDLTSVVTGPGGLPTQYITRVETEARTITATRTDVLYTAGVTSTLTQVIRSTLPLRTIVTTVVGTATQVNYITATLPADDAFPSGDPITYPPGSPFDPANYPSFPLDAQPGDVDLRLPEDAEVVLNEASLGIAEDNEISRVVESKSPDQEINVGGPVRAAVSPCDPQCSAARHEVCRLVRGAHTCVCRAGFARRSSADACKPSAAYSVQILLDRVSDDQLIYNSLLRNASHPFTMELSNEATFGIDQAMLGSRLAPRYHAATITKFMDTKETAMPTSVRDMDHGLIAEIKVEIARGDADGIEFEEELSESILKEALEGSLRSTNFSLGGTELFANRAVSVLAAQDFDECSATDHNDCSDKAHCFNTLGSFLCACKDGFKDMDDLPGRQCAVQTEQCAFCNFQGECIEKADGSYGCRCLQWFSGEQCQINLRVLLIVLVTVGSLLILLLMLCLVLCCLRARRNTRNKLGQMTGAPTFLRARGAGMGGSTLDRRAMIHETSSESSAERPRSPPTSFMAPPPPVVVQDKPERPPRPPRSDVSASRQSRSSFAEDRSVGIHTTLPPVLIPRVKGPAPRRPSVVSRGENGVPRVMIGADARSDLTASQQAYVDLLDQPTASIAPNHHGRTSRRESVTAASVHSIHARINRSRSQSRERLTDSFLHAHQLPQGSMRSRSSDRLHHSSHDFNSEFGVNFSFRHDGERSEARSYDETTVRPPVRTAGPDSFYSSKALSSQHISDEHQTMAERDGGSTLVYPQTELYRPVRDTDSLSDMSDHHSKATSSRAASRSFFS